MDNAEVIKELHRALAELIKILQENEYGIKKFPRFLYIHQQVSLAIEDPDALEDFPFLEDIKDMILGMSPEWEKVRSLITEYGRMTRQKETESM